MYYEGSKIENVADIEALVQRFYPEDVSKMDPDFYEESRLVMTELLKSLWRDSEKCMIECLRKGKKK